MICSNWALADTFIPVASMPYFSLNASAISTILPVLS
jgi:hypothetical protein